MTINSFSIGNVMSFAFTVILLNNIFFSGVYGASSLLIISGSNAKKRYIAGFCLSITWIMTASALMTYYTDMILEILPYGGYLKIPVYAAVLGVIYVLTLVILSGIMSAHFADIKKYIHTAAFNSAVFGSMLTAAQMNIGDERSLLTYIFYGLFSGIGFSLAVVIHSAVSKILHSENMPKSFKGYPASLIFLGFMGMAFFGI
jgi:electron transport complex protein RnfA